MDIVVVVVVGFFAAIVVVEVVVVLSFGGVGVGWRVSFFGVVAVGVVSTPSMVDADNGGHVVLDEDVEVIVVVGHTVEVKAEAVVAINIVPTIRMPPILIICFIFDNGCMVNSIFFVGTVSRSWSWS
jgi:hypothetical protein